VPIGPFIAWLAEVFAGTSGYWAQGRKQGRARSFQEMLLETTPLFSFQLQELKKGLKQRGFLTRRDNVEWVVFP
jgi:hypothetical protein